MDEFYDSSTTIEPASSATNADHDPAAEFLTGQLNEIRGTVVWYRKTTKLRTTLSKFGQLP